VGADDPGAHANGDEATAEGGSAEETGDGVLGSETEGAAERQPE
jgi:hypothetical protein